MAELEELKKIKKVYGEKFMKLCRELFPTLLETEGRLYEVLSLTFSKNSRTLYEDIINNGLQGEFKNYIYSKIDVEDKDKRIIANKTPYKLLDEAGYTLYECKTEEEIQSFKKYYAPGEELCTFWGGRLDRCEVFFAVKKDVEDIKREDFDKPKREDKYGTSVMGIQFNKSGMCTVSIKNRYNHTVNNPDATYGNDLDRITPGLTQSFKELLQQRGLKLNNTNVEKFEIPGYTVAGDGKYYKYNMEIGGRYYCPGNIVIEDGEVHDLGSPEKKLLFDYFVLDMEKKTIELYDSNENDSFIDDLQNFKKVEIRKNKENNTRTIIIQKEGRKEPIIIEIDKDNKIIGYSNKELTQAGDSFLYYNRELKELNLPQLTKAEEYFLYHNRELKELNFPQLKEAGYYFLGNNVELKELNLPHLTKVGHYFLCDNRELKELNLPQLIQVGDYFLNDNRELKELNLPQLIQVGDYFLNDNRELKELKSPQLKKVRHGFLRCNTGLKKLNLPQLVEVGDGFLSSNTCLDELNLPQLTKVRNYFLYYNKELKELNLSQLIEVGNYFLGYNEELRKLNLPQLTEVGNYFLNYNRELKGLYLPQLTQVGHAFLYNNEVLSELNLPNLTRVRKFFLNNNKGLRELNIPKLTEVGDSFLDNNKELRKLNLPELTQVEYNFLCDNKGLRQLNLPKLKKVKSAFLYDNEELIELNLPQLKEVEHSFLYKNKNLRKLTLPKLTQVGVNFLYKNKGLRELNLPNLKKVGGNFLGYNEGLTKLETPKLPKLQKKFAFIIDKNLKEEIKDNKKIVIPQSIAQLAKYSKITTSEINNANKTFNNLNKDKEINKE